MKKIEKKKIQKIGRPGYKLTKLKDSETGQKSILFEIEYPEITKDFTPRHRIMSSYEQKVYLYFIQIELPDDKFQYVVFAAEPYENIAFKVPNMEIDTTEGKYFINWDKDKKIYTVQLYFRERRIKALPALPQKPISFNPIGVRF